MSADMATASTTATSPASHRRTALIAGIFYLLTFVSIPTLALYRPVKGAKYVLGSGPDTSAIGGGILEIIVAVAGIGTAVVLFPILKKQNESAALGLVAAQHRRVRHHLRRSSVSVVNRDVKEVGSRGRCIGHQPCACRHVRPYLPPRTKLHARDMRPLAGIPSLPITPGA